MRQCLMMIVFLAMLVCGAIVSASEPVPAPDEDELGGYLHVAVNSSKFSNGSDCGGYLAGDVAGAKCDCTVTGVCSCENCQCGVGSKGTPTKPAVAKTTAKPVADHIEAKWGGARAASPNSQGDGEAVVMQDERRGLFRGGRLGGRLFGGGRCGPMGCN